MVKPRLRRYTMPFAFLPLLFIKKNVKGHGESFYEKKEGIKSRT